MVPCTDSSHPVPEAAKQPQNTTEPPPCLTAGQCPFLWKFNFADETWQKAPVLSNLSKGHSPRSSVACQEAFWQIPVLHFYDFLSTVVPRSSPTSVHFSSNSDG